MFDEEGRKIQITEFPRNLAPLSVSDLHTYITELKAEIARVESEIGKKNASAAAADAFFKTE